MTGAQVTVIIIFSIVATAVMIMSLYRYLGKVHGSKAGGEAELTALRQQIAQLNERIDRIGGMEPRVRVLEQIVTDSGAQTASQIEALREQAKIPMKDEMP